MGKIIEKQAQKKFVLKMLILTNSIRTSSLESTISASEHVSEKRVNLKESDLRFDPKSIGIKLLYDL